jgi:hypothetical protein
MTLNPHASYPHTHSYVLKLHRDCQPEHGAFVGRLEHLASGQQFEFSSADELIDCLVRAAALHGATPCDER